MIDGYSIHAARAETSDRLRRVLGVLSRGGWWSTLALQRIAEVCAVGTIVSELRANGYRIECRCVSTGRYVYRLANSGGNG